MGTELRFLKQMLVEGFEDSIDSEFWHGKALQLAIKFLPGDAPLVKHIVSSYQKHHSPSSEEIPEDQEVASAIKIIRPNDGITYNKLAPCIKDIPKPSVKLAPLDLSFNTYYDPPKQKEPEKSEINISECLKDSNFSIKRAESSEVRDSKVNKSQEASQSKTHAEKVNKSTEKKGNESKEFMKIVTDENMSHSKLLQSLEQPKNNSKGSKGNKKAFVGMKNPQQSQTIDHKDKRNEAANSPSLKSVSPSICKPKKKTEIIMRNRTEENTISSINNLSTGIKPGIGNRRKPNKSNSNERSKSKKANSKERCQQRPKTSKGQRKAQNITQGFMDRPSSVFENYK